MDIALKIFLLLLLSALVLTIPVILSAKLLGAPKQAFTNYLVTAIIGIVVLVVIGLATSNALLFSGLSFLMNGLIFSSRLQVSFVKGLLIAILAVVLFLVLVSVTGIVGVDFGFETYA